jgi:hypothetical protein
MITIIKSKGKKDNNGKVSSVNRYQVVEGEWDDSKPLPTPAKLTFNFNKAVTLAKNILFKKFCKIVTTEQEYKEEDIIHATPEEIEAKKAAKASKENKVEPAENSEKAE